jgi:CheY-like chemotaxis protein
MLDVASTGTGAAGLERLCCEPNPMKILCLDPLDQCGPIKSVLERAEHHVTCVVDAEEALDMVRAGHFSAVLIAEEIRNSEAFALVSKLHRERPELLVFSLRAWRRGLAEVLQSLEETLPIIAEP